MFFVAGYPNHGGIQFYAEVTDLRSNYRVPILTSTNPGETWLLVKLPLAAMAKFRIVAIDRSAGNGGWIGFSLPFEIQTNNYDPLRQLSAVFLTAAAAIFFFLAPGLLLRQRRPFHAIWIVFPGILGLAVIGLIAWTAPHALAPAWISRVALCLFALYATYRLWRVPLTRYTDVFERRVLLIVIALAAIGTAKASYSIGLSGELFRSTISRTSEVGGVSDSGLSYHVVQLIAFQRKPFSELGKKLYAHYGAWNFSDRGALAPLAVAPILLSGPVRISPEMPNKAWTVFDPEGYADYRIVMIVLAACSLLPAFGLARLFLSSEWALLAFLVTVSAPFTVHEVYFTWPKLLGASFILLAAYLIFRGRYLLAGLAAGLGYLTHPSALFGVASLLGLAIALTQPATTPLRSLMRNASVWLPRVASVLSGAAMCMFIWFLCNRKHNSQGQFLLYFLQADGPGINFGHWFKHRFDSFCNTVVPLNVFLLHSDRPGVNAIGEKSSAVVHFNFQYWDAIPFGAGLLYFFCLARQSYIAWFKGRGYLLLVFVLPFFLYTVYWGSDNTGMLRTGLHPWFLGLLIASTFVWYKFQSRAQTLWRFASWALLSRVAGLSFILLIAPMWSQHQLYERRFAATDLMCVFVMLAGSVFLAVHTFRWSERLRRQVSARSYLSTQADRSQLPQSTHSP